MTMFAKENDKENNKGVEGTTFRLRETITKNALLPAEVFRIDDCAAPRSGKPNEKRFVHVIPQGANTAINECCNYYAGMSR